VELFDLAFTRVGYSRAELPPAVQSIEDVAAIIGGAVRELLAAHTAEDGTPIDVAGTGVSLPGQVDPTRGVDVFAPNWGWHELPVMEALTNALDGPVVVDNPLMALATGELWFGVGRRYDDFVAVNLGTGVGCGIVLERQLLRGNGNSAGEWGHSTLVWDGRECGCGRHGCVEAYVGVEGIRHTLAEEDPDHDLLQVEHQREFMQNLMRADVTGDPAARRTVERTGDYLAAGLGNLINILNPEHICVRGWITGYVGGSLRDRVAERLESESLPGPLRNVSIEVPDESLGVTLGMAVLAFEGFLERVGLPSSSTIGANAGAPRARAVGAAAGTRIWSGGRAG
jgi:predicted NBD/HSP70 family sugar kinase